MARHHAPRCARAAASGRARRPCRPSSSARYALRTAKPTGASACQKGTATPEINVTLLAHCESMQQQG